MRKYTNFWNFLIRKLMTGSSTTTVTIMSHSHQKRRILTMMEWRHISFTWIGPIRKATLMVMNRSIPSLDPTKVSGAMQMLLHAFRHQVIRDDLIFQTMTNPFLLVRVASTRANKAPMSWIIKKTHRQSTRKWLNLISHLRKKSSKANKFFNQPQLGKTNTSN